MAGSVTLITGGVKSGKSAYGLKTACAYGPKRSFIATATAGDDEMVCKIAAHQSERGDGWKTCEEPREIAAVIEQACRQSDVVLLDCLTMWVSNLLTLFDLSEKSIQNEFENLARALSGSQCPVFVITNEVGLGIMPADRLSRRYQNLLGLANKKIAGLAESVYLLVAGIPLKIK